MKKDTSFQKRGRLLVLCLCLLALCLPGLRAQPSWRRNISLMLTLGRGWPLPIVITPNDSLDMTFTAPVAGFQSGFHFLVVRVKDEQSGWSTAQVKLFYISPLLSAYIPPPPPFTLIEANIFSIRTRGWATARIFYSSRATQRTLSARSARLACRPANTISVFASATFRVLGAWPNGGNSR